MSAKRYRVGIDVGLNSVGLAAIEVDDANTPIRILNAQSVIHDGGVDPTRNKDAATRKSVSGESRRARRMLRRRRKRLNQLDELLQRLGYPIIDPETLDTFDEWKIRSGLADVFIEDEATRKENISIAIRHIARHRGWRNPYHRVESLLVDNPYSEQYRELKTRAEAQIGHALDEDMTSAQIVIAAWPHRTVDNARLRTSSKRGEGLLPSKLMQEDNANELKRIFSVQRVPESEGDLLFHAIFRANSPKGSAEKRVGRDPFDAAQPRALKASLVFQRYRIANVLTNLRIQENKQERPLTIEEKQTIFAMLVSDDSKDITWGDVASHLGYERRQLRGVGKTTEDGEDRISSTPPRLTSFQRICEADKKIAKPLQAWWQNASGQAQESMIRLLSNTVDLDGVHGDISYEEALDFIDGLDDEGLSRLDSVDLPAGRAAYGEETLRKLTERMLTTNDDLHAARKVLFHVSDYWRPPADPIGASLGNPSVDRVLRIVSRWLSNCRNRWGTPVSVQIEHVRSAFDSVATARQYERRTGNRSVYRSSLAKQLRESEHLDRVRSEDIRRIEAIQRQNGECLYCGRPIAFRNCEMDHIVPRKGAGSTNTRTNLAAVCIECNRLKSNIPFAVWADSEAAHARGVNLKESLQRVDHMLYDRNADTSQTWRRFKQDVKIRLKQTYSDEPIDNRSIESVAWMADELHRRIDWYFNAGHYLEECDELRPRIMVEVRVFQGRVTALARRASGLEGRIHFFGARYKTRLDRRHHAMDASVIAIMRPSVAQTLVERDSLRESQLIAGRLANGERSWKEYPYEGCPGYVPFQQWRAAMESLLELLNDALDHDRIVVRQPMRLQLGNSIAHDATVKKLLRVRLGDAMDADLVRRASTPALWCALTRLPDFDAAVGLPANDSRTIAVHGVTYSASDEVEFFDGQSAQLAVRGGSADIGSSIHHARVYRYWKQNAKGVRKYWYGMIRVFQVDLLRARGADLFSEPLPPQSVSMRWGEPRTVQAVQAGNATYLGWMVVGDELRVEFPRETALNGQIGEFVDWCDGSDSASTAQCSWVLDGFFSNKQLRLHPRLLASEGLMKLGKNQEIPDGVQKVVAKTGWISTVDVFGGFSPTVIRRNTLGEARWRSQSGLPCSWRWFD
ncbi:restriction endonuclease [Bifidobacterium sp. UTCIF-37]|uniref:type II CRISPR RNA-guided endonuclease Cas9 n=1 Tax=unclassified Bifidobacterium TaxID=2608897 RepID=UPI0015E36228|nr:MULTISPECIES: type II CRISPR RNA-guided endonuclease Cas9 [unclassified Bifidobacterium]TPF86950.1 restriction endonuclease [Bifidobacterium sp. UTCIF-37]TPF90819.1 restriction endonuclease [Bifidobacterium sp. UTCIF-38]